MPANQIHCCSGTAIVTVAISDAKNGLWVLVTGDGPDRDLMIPYDALSLLIERACRAMAATDPGDHLLQGDAPAACFEAGVKFSAQAARAMATRIESEDLRASSPECVLRMLADTLAPNEHTIV